MSERRRRRLNDEGEEDTSNNTDNTSTSASANPTRGERPSECESEEESGDVDLSESESAAGDGTEKEEETEEGSDTETEEGSYTEDASDSGTETEGADDYSDEEGLDGERQSGDGQVVFDDQEQPEDDKPDDDEDKKNPAYVPRKGAFYEHDFRDGLEDVEVKEEVVDEKKLKKLWQDEGKWSHDFYREDLQMPKSREELIALYGYDIRAADKPPEAPPMKSGRGRGQRRREANVKDFMPRMAVIDTTEYGTDTIPSLDDDGLITYQPAKSSRGRGSGYTNRGGGNNRFRGKDNDGYPTPDKGDRYYKKPQRDDTSNSPSQDARNFGDYPTLDESRGVKSNNRNYAKEGGYNKSRDYPQYGNHSTDEQEQSNSYGYDRNRKNTGSGRFGNNNSNDGGNFNRRADRNNTNYQQRNDGRNRSSGDGGVYHQGNGDDNSYNNRKDNYRQMDSNWRRASEQPGGDEYRDNNRSGYQGHGGRGGGGGNYGPKAGGFARGKARSYGGGDVEDHRYHNAQREVTTRDENVTSEITAKRNNNRTAYDNTPPRHQQQNDNIVDSREFTSSKAAQPVKQPYSADERTLPPRHNRTPGDNASLSSQGPALGDARAIAAAGGGNGMTSNNVVISNKENVQTINVTITSTTTEKKSYAKERRGKGTTPKAGELQQGPAVVMGGPLDVKEGMGNPAKHHPPPPVSGSRDVSSLPMVPSTKRYSSQRQQQTVPKAGYNTDNPAGLTVEQGAKLYNPALPPPTLFQHDSASGGAKAPPGPQDPTQRFNPSMLPPGNAALPFGLPVPTAGLPIPGPTGSPNVFQGPPVSMGGPTAAGPALIGPPFIAPGMIYATSPTPNPRVPPPATPVGFPIPLAYTTGHPPPPTQPPTNVVPPPVSQGGPNAVPGGQQVSNQPKNVYRGDITYYAPELQQPSRTTQKRPKSAIPIVDPQEMRQWKQMERNSASQSHQPPPTSQSQQPAPPPPEGSISTTIGVIHKSETPQTKEVTNPNRTITSDTSNDISGSSVVALEQGKTESTKQTSGEVAGKNKENTSSIALGDPHSDGPKSDIVCESNSSENSNVIKSGVVNTSGSGGNNDSTSQDHSAVVRDSQQKDVDISDSSVDTAQMKQNSDKGIKEENLIVKPSSSQTDPSIKQELSTPVDNAGDASGVGKSETGGVADPTPSPDIKVDSNPAQS